MTDERLHHLTLIYRKLMRYYMQGLCSMRWDPSEKLGASHRPTFAEFVDHANYCDWRIADDLARKTRQLSGL